MAQENVTELLEQWRGGDQDAADRIIAATYQELRRLARGIMRGERSNHTLQATGLVHEAYLRLFQDAPVEMASRQEFVRLMAAQMRRYLIDHARRRRADKRGGGVAHEPFDSSNPPAVPWEDDDPEDPAAYLDRLDGALTKLAADHPRVAEIIRLRFFLDLSIDETAETIGMKSGTVKRDFAFGRAWLMRELGSDRSQGST
jgi:RNA polymerase sigma factor (TIGR02999 family)